MLTQQHRLHAQRTGAIGQRAVAGIAGGVFRALTALVPGVDPGGVQGHAQAGAYSAAMRRKAIGCSLQTVVNMNGTDLPRPPSASCQQQSGGVGAAAVGDGQRPGKWSRKICQRRQRRVGSARGLSLTWLRLWCR